MTESPDPLGKRALFWAPAERDEGGPRRAAERDVPGKHALFSAEARASAGAATPPLTPSRRDAQRPAHDTRSSARQPARDMRPGAGRGILNTVTVECSTCGGRSEIHVTEFLMLHLPVWLWRPGRGYTRFMTCPACRRRTWVSASWAPWSR